MPPAKKLNAAQALGVLIELQRLVPANMLRDASIGLLGQRRQGKTTLGEDLLYHIKFRRAYALCGSVGSMKSFRKFIFDTYIQRATIERVEELVQQQAERSEDESLTEEEVENCLIIDDKGFDKKFMKHATMGELASNGRQFKMATLIMVQYLYQMTTELRGNLDYIIFTREQSVDNSEKARKQYGGLCGRGATGVAVWSALCAESTMNRCVMVIDQTITDSVSVEDCYFWYRARFPMPRWRLGDKAYEDYHLARMRAAALDQNSDLKFANPEAQKRHDARKAAANALAAAVAAGGTAADVPPPPSKPKFVSPASIKIKRVVKKPPTTAAAPAATTAAAAAAVAAVAAVAVPVGKVNKSGTAALRQPSTKRVSTAASTASTASRRAAPLAAVAAVAATAQVAARNSTKKATRTASGAALREAVSDVGANPGTAGQTKRQSVPQQQQQQQRTNQPAQKQPKQNLQQQQQQPQQAAVSATRARAAPKPQAVATTPAATPKSGATAAATPKRVGAMAVATAKPATTVGAQSRQPASQSTRPAAASAAVASASAATTTTTTSTQAIGKQTARTPRPQDPRPQEPRQHQHQHQQQQQQQQQQRDASQRQPREATTARGTADGQKSSSLVGATAARAVAKTPKSTVTQGAAVAPGRSVPATKSTDRPAARPAVTAAPHPRPPPTSTPSRTRRAVAAV